MIGVVAQKNVVDNASKHPMKAESNKQSYPAAKLVNSSAFVQ